ncbi:lipopolysaccharide biosynthesis protein [Deinococcus peraridilitoris]|uniref:Membrane protein involved in the export of O-antigen and teichoic acid n=1 Tax=Deinococcus peraridilitoris (strain DSM 19664 / LMG 22246 / CIP 109416 / KR-200) TaxID=937777 RepID=L0A5G1_DEIPD|nr:oligosaccharide flippase family protein [Deinococcus peraridilitoris]AFZ68260.1 membrane protein involved in the export of O-antigen and teichoic acid [Deinococcus peraridilitoris DSM 19664]
MDGFRCEGPRREGSVVKGVAAQNSPRRLQVDRTILSNAVSFFGATAATATLGFAYSFFADRLFGKDAFGLAQAGVSAMMLLGGLGLLGLTTLLVGELPRARTQPGRLITAALAVSGLAGALLGWLFCFLAPLVSPELGSLVASPLGKLLFTLGVILTTVTQVFDYAMVGLLRSNLQLWRNILASSVRVGALWLAVFYQGPLQIVALLVVSTWTLGHIVSLVLLGAALRARGERVWWRPDWSAMRDLKAAALSHHALNISWQAPSWVFPLLVTAFLGASFNASFYVAWMMFFLVFKVTESLTTVLYAVNAADTSLLAQKMRFTLKTSLALTVLASLVVLPVAPFALGLFGETYAQEATGALRLLVLGVLALIVKMHFLAVSQVQRRIARATRYMAAGAVLEIVLAALGVTWGGMTGLALGIVIAQVIEAAVMAPTVLGALRGQPRLATAS